jgi:hypothetical protein
MRIQADARMVKKRPDKTGFGGHGFSRAGDMKRDRFACGTGQPVISVTING